MNIYIDDVLSSYLNIVEYKLRKWKNWSSTEVRVVI